jgi:nucleoside-diphosphate-sugar epimerase
MLLSSGHQVRVLDALLVGGQSLLGVWSHPDFEFRFADIRDRDAVCAALAGMEAVVHLAAVVGDPACARHPELARAVNLEASLVLLEESQRAGVNRFIFASTCSNYGRMTDPSVYVDEDSELRPVSLYAETKVAVEQTLLQDRGDDWCPTPLRFATIFGVSPRMRFDLTVNEFTLEMLIKGRLVVFGEQFWRPYVHVRDVAHAIKLVLASSPEKVRRRVFNVGHTSQNFQKQQLVELIRPFAPDAVVEYVHKAEDPRDYRVSFARIQEELGFQASRTVADGISEIARLVHANAISDYSSPQLRN